MSEDDKPGGGVPEGPVDRAAHMADRLERALEQARAKQRESRSDDPATDQPPGARRVSVRVDPPRRAERLPPRPEIGEEERRSLGLPPLTAAPAPDPAADAAPVPFLRTASAKAPASAERPPRPPRPGRLVLGTGDTRAVSPPRPGRPAPQAAPVLLKLAGIEAHIGRYAILHGVDLTIPKGQVTMLLGRNGAGKTTTLRTIMGLVRARAGGLLWEGRDLARLSPTAIARLGVGYVPEDMGIFGDLTVEENMRLGARVRRLDPARLDWILDAFPALRTFWTRPAGTLSGGQKQMLSLARVMVAPRALYLIDEPTKGLAPAIVSTLVAALRSLKTEGASILMVEQNFAVARALGDTCAVMEDGRIAWSGTMAALAADTALQDRLMGLSLEPKT